MEDESENTGNQSYKRCDQNATAEGAGVKVYQNLALRVVNDCQVETLGSIVGLKRLPEIRYCACVSCAGPYVHLPGKMCGWITGNFSKVRKSR